ncbi:ImmA/IrrE family metallo-endopeptidase [Enterococcus gilvus]
MERSGIYFAEEKTIFLSNNLLDENSDFEISHELGHCIEKHEKISAYYNANDYSRRKLEFEANRIAIEILLFIWSNEYDFDKEQLNAVKFMEYYKIPWSLESCVREKMRKYG